MFGYLLLVICISAFFGFMGFLIMGESTGVGIACLIVGLIAGGLWLVSKKRAKRLNKNKCNQRIRKN